MTKDCTLKVRVEKTTEKNLKAMADRAGCTVSDILRQLIKNAKLEPHVSLRATSTIDPNEIDLS